MRKVAGISSRLLRSLQLDNIPNRYFLSRPYQVELLNTLLGKNIVICLNDSLSKAFVSLMMIRELKQGLWKSLSAGGYRALIVCSEAATVELLSSVIVRHTQFTVKLCDPGSSFTSRENCHNELEANHVLVMTVEQCVALFNCDPQVVTYIGLLILDNCHEAIHNSHYSDVMHHINSLSPSERQPRIVGMTTTLINALSMSSSELERMVDALEQVLHCSVDTAVDQATVDLYNIRPLEQTVICPDYVDSTGLCAEFGKTLTSMYDLIEALSHTCNGTADEIEAGEVPSSELLDVLKRAVNECMHILMTLGPWCLSCAGATIITELRKLKAKASDQNVRLVFQLVVTQLRSIRHRMDHVFEREIATLEDLMLLMSPKVRALVDILHTFKPREDFIVIGDTETSDSQNDSDDSLDLSSGEDEEAANGDRPPARYMTAQKNTAISKSENREPEREFSGIVFCETAHTAYALNKLIEELCNWDSDLYFVRSHDITGARADGTQLYKKQEIILRKYRMRDVNLLISTGILESGIDLPRCSLVVRFDPPTSYLSYVQSKGRARSPAAQFWLLIEESRRQRFEENMELFRSTEKVLTSRFHGKVKNEDDEEVTDEWADSQLPAYCVASSDGQSAATMFTAIAIINRYCLRLPSDAFTHLTPQCKVEPVAGSEPPMYVATLLMPINCPIKQPIKSQPMQGRLLAKMAAALKACELLHKCGELDDQFVPVSKEMMLIEDTDGDYDDGDSMGQARPGSTKHKQYYQKHQAACLKGRPAAGQSSCLYDVGMVLTRPISDEQNTRGRRLYPPQDTSRHFGLLTTVELPQVPTFPVFSRSGEVEVSVELLDRVVLDESQLKLLLTFHGHMFTKVLRLDKDPMIYDPLNSKQCPLVVPLDLDADGKSVIDWKFVSTVVNYYENGNKHRVTGEPFIFRDEDFADAVISPVYRNSDQPQYFYVAEICSDLNPKSPFPSPELFDTFYEYYTSKYNVKITNVTQPLIDVDHTSARLNLLTPRYVNQKGVALPTSSAEMRRQRRENLQQKQILIPELCAIHPVPASMWRKVVLLPTVLYRLNYLLIAEELRVLIARRTSVGSASLPADFRFPRLHFSFGDPVPSAAADSGAMESIEKTSGVQEPAGDKELPANDAAIVENSELGGATVNGHNLPDSAHGDIMTDAKVKVNGLCDDIAALKLSNGDHKSSNENGENAVNFALKTVSSEEATRLTLNLDQDYSANISTGPSPCIILQTLTMSNANDFFNLERLETIGDSFLKFAITVYLYCSYPGIHEGKLSYLRSKQVSNYNLYKLGRRKGLPERMVPIKFEPSENWLPPGYVIRKEGAFRDLNVQLAPSFTDSQDKTTSSTSEVTEVNCSDDTDDDHGRLPAEAIVDVASTNGDATMASQQQQYTRELNECTRLEDFGLAKKDHTVMFHIPYNLQTQHSLPDKSIADCVEALIGCYLTTCGQQAALRLMRWLGLRVLIPRSSHGIEGSADATSSCTRSSSRHEYCGNNSTTGENTHCKRRSCSRSVEKENVVYSVFGLPMPPSPLLTTLPSVQQALELHLLGFESLEEKLQYRFRDRSYLLQAFTHASYHYNNITDCYQRLEFLGDAILDYVITRHLFEDSQQHSPGVLTDLRSALVNNNIFAALAVKWEFHKYFMFVSPQLFAVIDKFVARQQAMNNEIYVEEEVEGEDEPEKEDTEIPKALGDIFESVAGAIYLDSGMSLNAVWNVYYRIMKPCIDLFIEKIPKSPVRELLEMEPETVKFEKPERTLGGRVRVTVNIVSKGSFVGVGRNYRIAKSAAARRALKHLKMLREMKLDDVDEKPACCEECGTQRRRPSRRPKVDARRHNDDSD